VTDGTFHGHRVVHTDDRVMVMARRFFKFRAEIFLVDYPPMFPGYHLRIEKVGFLRYEIVAYQNKLEP
jgi:hypothetical protein